MGGIPPIASSGGPELILPADPGGACRIQRTEVLAAIERVIDSGWYLQGRETFAFEDEFATWLGVGHCIATGSGTGALELALRTLGIGPGDCVIAPSFTAVATIAAIVLTGATPLLVDVDPDSFVLDPALVERTITERRDLRVKAVLPVHLYGHPADLPALARIAGSRGIALLEDCAQSHDASHSGVPTGAWGTMAAFSFYPTKNLAALGDAGALVTSDPMLAERARSLQQYGWRERYVSEVPGMNTRLDEIQAAVLRLRLLGLCAANARRRAIAEAYAQGLSGTAVALPSVASGVSHAWHQYVIRTPCRDGLRAYLGERGIGTQVLYPQPVHLQPGYRARVEVGVGGLTHTERLSSEILSLPLHPTLGDGQVGRVIEAVRRWAAEARR